MSENILAKRGYQKLLLDLKKVIEIGKKKVEEVARYQLVLTYWEVGKRIEEEKLTNNANYSNLILEDLNRDLGLEKTTLRRSIQFFNLYPNKPEISNLTWSHYRHLLAIKDDDLRIQLEEKTKEESWNVVKLGQAIKTTKENNEVILDKSNFLDCFGKFARVVPLLIKFCR